MATTEQTKILCPHCQAHIYTLEYVSGQTAPPVTDHSASRPATAADGQHAPGVNGDSLNSEACPKCQNYKKPGFRLCYSCSQEDMDQCPVDGCERMKRKQFPTCYECRQNGMSAPARTGTPATAGHPYDRPAEPVAAGNLGATSFEDEDDDLPF